MVSFYGCNNLLDSGWLNCSQRTAGGQLVDGVQMGQLENQQELTGGHVYGRISQVKPAHSCLEREKDRQTGLKQERGSLHWSQAGIRPPLSCRAALFLCSTDSNWSCKDSPVILAEMTASQVNCRCITFTVDMVVSTITSQQEGCAAWWGLSGTCSTPRTSS